MAEIIRIKRRISARARRMSLSVHPGGSVVLTIPKHSKQQGEAAIEAFLQASKPWLSKTLKRARKSRPQIEIGGGGGKRIQKLHYARHKTEAQKLAVSLVESWNAVMNLEYSRVAVRNQMTRWGSCSHRRSLTFNYRILFLPRVLADYIVVHELAHLKHFNHSRQFWNLVESVMPDCAHRKKELKKYRIS